MKHVLSVFTGSTPAPKQAPDSDKTVRDNGDLEYPNRHDLIHSEQIEMNRQESEHNLAEREKTLIHNFKQQSVVQLAKFLSLLDKHLHSLGLAYGQQIESLKQQLTQESQALISKNNQALKDWKSKLQAQKQFYERLLQTQKHLDSQAHKQQQMQSSCNQYSPSQLFPAHAPP